jgi:nucleoside-diphosphate-sugar epimerase
MRIVVIGGTGFIGSQVITQLSPRNEVIVVHRGKHPATGLARYLAGDRDRLGEHSAEFRRFQPDVALDMISGDERQARAVVDVFRGVACRLVTISSGDVYRTYEIARGLVPGPPEPVPLTEDAPLRSHFYLARNTPLHTIFDWVTPDYEKILVERAVRDVPDLPATVLRLPMVYGPGDPLHRFHPFLKRMDDGREAIPIEETWAQWRGPMGYVENVADAIALAVTSEAAAGRTYNVAEAEPLAWADWARAVGDAAGWHGRILTLPRERTPQHLLPPFNAEQHWTTDSSRIRKELGYSETIPRAEALARTVAWERAHPAPFNPAAFDYEAESRAIT